ncbi:hypothetical protein ACFYYB_38345 [Streptomyces sp. NPDC002886]|uniref:hypothetical protein n=1 Tax=Streptomyces sp. NPDC002886 TaxID=3364667 RepID=UPI0036AA8399
MSTPPQPPPAGPQPQPGPAPGAGAPPPPAAGAPAPAAAPAAPPGPPLRQRIGSGLGRFGNSRQAALWVTVSALLLAGVGIVLDRVVWDEPGRFTVVDLFSEETKDAPFAEGSTENPGTGGTGTAPAAVLTMVLKNNTDDLHTFKAIGVRTKAEVKVDECKKGSGGDTLYTGGFEVQAPPLGQKSETPIPLGYSVPVKGIEARHLTIGAASYGGTGSGGPVLALEVYLVEDDGKVFEVGRVAVQGNALATTVYPMNVDLLPVGDRVDPDCVAKIADGIDQMQKKGYKLSKDVRAVRDGARTTAEKLRG